MAQRTPLIAICAGIGLTIAAGCDSYKVTYNQFVVEKAPASTAMTMRVAKNPADLAALRAEFKQIDEREWRELEMRFLAGDERVAVVVVNGTVIEVVTQPGEAVAVVRLQKHVGGFGLAILAGDPNRPFKGTGL